MLVGATMGSWRLLFVVLVVAGCGPTKRNYDTIPEGAAGDSGTGGISGGGGGSTSAPYSLKSSSFSTTTGTLQRGEYSVKHHGIFSTSGRMCRNETCVTGSLK